MIGTDITGTLAIANAPRASCISDGASNNTIGGLTTTAGDRPGNMISGNTDDGVQLTVQNTDSGPTGNLVEGNSSAPMSRAPPRSPTATTAW